MDFDSDQSLKEWVKDKPLSILQLDPADRAVLRIAGKFSICDGLENRIFYTRTRCYCEGHVATSQISNALFTSFDLVWCIRKFTSMRFIMHCFRQYEARIFRINVRENVLNENESVDRNWTLINYGAVF